eukprot:Rmarinus@m.28463
MVQVSKGVCDLCPEDSTLPDEVLGPFPDRQKPGKFYFAHDVCLDWAPEVWGADGEYYDVDKAVKRGRALKCAHCGARNATVGCHVRACRKSFHHVCTKPAKCYRNFQTGQVFCRQHCNQAQKRDFDEGRCDTPPPEAQAMVASFQSPVATVSLSPAQGWQRIAEHVDCRWSNGSLHFRFPVIPLHEPRSTPTTQIAGHMVVLMAGHPHGQVVLLKSGPVDPVYVEVLVCSSSENLKVNLPRSLNVTEQEEYILTKVNMFSDGVSSGRPGEEGCFILCEAFVSLKTVPGTHLWLRVMKTASNPEAAHVRAEGGSGARAVEPSPPSVRGGAVAAEGTTEPTTGKLAVSPNWDEHVVAFVERVRKGVSVAFDRRVCSFTMRANLGDGRWRTKNFKADPALGENDSLAKERVWDFVNSVDFGEYLLSSNAKNWKGKETDWEVPAYVLAAQGSGSSPLVSHRRQRDGRVRFLGGWGSHDLLSSGEKRRLQPPSDPLLDSAPAAKSACLSASECQAARSTNPLHESLAAYEALLRDTTQFDQTIASRRTHLYSLWRSGGGVFG